MAKKTNISDKELDRDIVNLRLPEPDITPVELDDLSFYEDDFIEELKKDSSKK